MIILKRNPYILLFFLLLITISGRAQITIPYYQDFDSLTVTGWTHYSTFGNDDWERGAPTKIDINMANSTPNAFITKLDVNYSAFSTCYLQSPSFDLSNVTGTPYIGFKHKKKIASNTTLNVQYSINGGTNWNNLDNAPSQKLNWYLTGSFYSAFLLSRHSLDFLSGNPNVIFRFEFNSGSLTDEGWMIDDFEIGIEEDYIFATTGIPVSNISKYTDNIVLSANMNKQSTYYINIPSQTTNFYLSNDIVLDINDTLLDQKIHSGTGNFTHTLPVPTNSLYAGTYYILHEHDALNQVNETNENLHVSYTILTVDSSFITPYRYDVETNDLAWTPYSAYTTSGTPYPDNFWERKSFVRGSEEVLSGNYALHHDILSPYTISNYQWLESPFFDLTSNANNMLCYWVKHENRMDPNGNYGAKTDIKFSSVDYPYFTVTGSGTPNIGTSITRFGFGWDCQCYLLNSQSLAGFLKFRFGMASNAYYVPYLSFISYDDIYVGKILPDITIANKQLQLTTSNFSVDTIHYQIFNGGYGSTPISNTKFYWSTDSIFDVGDIFLGTKSELAMDGNSNPTGSGSDYNYTVFTYTKPTTSPGLFYIFYSLDADSLIQESWEINNLSYLKLLQSEVVLLPYDNNFEMNIDGWYHEAYRFIDSWQWGSPSGDSINTPFSGSKAFHTLAPQVPDSSRKLDLYLPPFDLGSISDPVLEFNMQNESFYSSTTTARHVNINYSQDNGVTWRVLDTGNNLSFKAWTIPYELDEIYAIDNLEDVNVYISRLFRNFEEHSLLNNYHYQTRDTRNITHFNLYLNHLSPVTTWFRFTYCVPKNPSGEGVMIDDFKISQQFIDLTMDILKPFYVGGINGGKYPINFDIFNKGNFKASSVSVNIYGSNDTILDGSDIFMSNLNILKVLPDMMGHYKTILNFPAQQINYLLFHIDPTNSIAESNESNNIGVWPVISNSVSNFPYFEDFSSLYPTGWNYMVMSSDNTLINPDYLCRVSTINPPDETHQRTNFSRKEANVEFLNQFGGNQAPNIHFQSPVFDFSNSQSLQLSLKIFATQLSGAGAIMEYTIDNGNTWEYLTDSLGGTNWYNLSSVTNLSNLPGWGFSNYILDSSSINISSLCGQSNVSFRVRFRGKGFDNSGTYASPFRIDDFRIDAADADIIALTQGVFDTINGYRLQLQ